MVRKTHLISSRRTIGIRNGCLSLRRAVYTLIKKKKLKVRPCYLSEAVKGLRVISASEKDSASQTAIAFGDLAVPSLGKNMEVVIKFSFTSRTKDNSLAVERQLYMDVIDPMIMKNYTPHVIMALGVFTCNDFIKQVRSVGPRSQLARDILKNIKNVNPAQYDLNQLHILMMERAHGKTLMNVLNHPASLTWPVWESVLFQITYTLAVFNELGLQQNDLHYGNVWLEPRRPHQFNQYTGPNGMVFTVPIQVAVRIFDFDLAVKFPTAYSKVEVRNGRIDEYGFCESAGVCNDRNDKYDFFRVMYFIYHSKPIAQVKQWIEQAIPDRQLLDSTPFLHYGSLCRVSGGMWQQKCDPWVPSDKQVKSPALVLKTQFAIYRKPATKRPECEKNYALPSQS